MTAHITFVANLEDNPANALASDFWNGEATLSGSGYWGRRATITFRYTIKELCAKYGMKNPHALRLAQAALGCPILPPANCCKCSVEVPFNNLPFPSRTDFLRFANDSWANPYCGPCAAIRDAEQERLQRERKRQRQEADKAYQEAVQRKREKLREKYGPRFVDNCPECEGVLYLRPGRYDGSWFIACSSYPRCTHRRPMPIPAPPPDVSAVQRAQAALANAPKCPACGAALSKRNGIYGPFIGCTAYPRCRYTEVAPPCVSVATSEEIVGVFE